MHARDGLPDLPDHLEDALWRVESARLEPAAASGVLVCGSGSAARGARLAAEALGERLDGPLIVLAGDRPPPEVDSGWCVLCASFSGEDAAALDCFEAAGGLGARRLAVSTGGRLVERARDEGVPVVGLPAIVEPDAALGYFFVAAAEAAALAGMAPRIESEIRAAAAYLREHAAELAAGRTPPEADSETARLLSAAMSAAG